MNIKRVLFIILVTCAFNNVSASYKSTNKKEKGFTKFEAVLKIVDKTIDIALRFVNAIYSGNLTEDGLDKPYNDMTEMINAISNVPQLKSRDFDSVEYKEEYMDILSNDLSDAIENLNNQFSNFERLRPSSNHRMINTYIAKDFIDHAVNGRSNINPVLNKLHVVFVGRSRLWSSKSYLEYFADYLTVSVFCNFFSPYRQVY